MKKSKLFIAACVSTLLVFGCSSGYEDELIEAEDNTTVQEESADDKVDDKTDDTEDKDSTNDTDDSKDDDNSEGDPTDPTDPADPEDPEPPAPLEEKGMPVIYITPSTGNTDFVTKPKSKVVDKNGKEPYYVDCAISVVNKYGQTELTDSPAEVKVRGNWTTNYDKKALRIKFSKDADGNKKHPMLGLNGGKDFKNWVLLAEYKDWSMLRNSCAFKMAKIIDSKYYASDFQPVNVYFRVPNKDGELEDKYWGVYLLAEQQEINKKRVNITEADENYTGTDIGYLLEYDSYAYNEPELQHFSATFGQTIKDINNTAIYTNSSDFNKYFTIKNDVYDAAQRNFIKNYIDNVWLICYNAAYNGTYKQFNSDYTALEDCPEGTTCQECIEKVIDVDSLVAAYVLQEIACDPDLYYSSFYLNVDFGKKGDKKLRFDAPWDFDSTMGNKEFCENGQGFYAGTKAKNVNKGTGNYGNPWMLILTREPWFQKKVRDKWNAVCPTLTAEIPAFIDAMTEKYAEDYANNYEKWQNIGKNNTVGNELNSKAAACKTQAEAAAWLKTWLTTRFSGISTAWNSLTIPE